MAKNALYPRKVSFWRYLYRQDKDIYQIINIHQNITKSLIKYRLFISKQPKSHVMVTY